MNKGLKPNRNTKAEKLNECPMAYKERRRDTDFDFRWIAMTGVREKQAP